MVIVIFLAAFDKATEKFEDYKEKIQTEAFVDGWDSAMEETSEELSQKGLLTLEVADWLEVEGDFTIDENKISIDPKLAGYEQGFQEGRNYPWDEYLVSNGIKNIAKHGY